MNDRWLGMALPILLVGSASRAGEAVAEAEPVKIPRLLVAELKVEEGVSESTARLLNELLLAEVQQETEQYEVFGESDLRSLIQHETDKQLAGCDDVSCLAELGGAMGADFVVFGNVGAVGETYLLNLKVVKIATAKVTARWSEPVGSEQTALVAAVSRAVADLFGAAEPAQPEPKPQPTQPEQPEAVQPPPPATQVAASTPLYKKWWLWTAVGVAVAGAVAGSTYVLCCTGSDNEDRGSLRVGVTLPPPSGVGP